MPPEPIAQRPGRSSLSGTRWPIAPCLFGLFIIVVSHGACSEPRMVEMDDGWRRTASGWENRDTWNTRPTGAWLPKFHMSIPHRSRGRIDAHPAVLALMQIVGVLLGLFAFPPHRDDDSPGAGNWRTGLARSFRASAFGS